MSFRSYVLYGLAPSGNFILYNFVAVRRQNAPYSYSLWPLLPRDIP